MGGPSPIFAIDAGGTSEMAPPAPICDCAPSARTLTPRAEEERRRAGENGHHGGDASLRRRRLKRLPDTRESEKTPVNGVADVRDVWIGVHF